MKRKYIKYTVDDLIFDFPKLINYHKNVAVVGLGALHERYKPTVSGVMTDMVSLDVINPEGKYGSKRKVFALEGKLFWTRFEQSSVREAEIRMESKNGDTAHLMSLFVAYVNARTWGNLRKLISRYSVIQIP